MREIKFRAFITDYGEDLENNMVYLDNLKVYGDIAYVYDSETDYEYQIDSKYIMQCTWLKDKNLNEVYEWDIVKVDDKMYQVTFDVLWSWFTLEGINNITQVYVDKLIDDWEVIWNIYENKDLLN